VTLQDSVAVPRRTTYDDPAVQPLLDELQHEYSTRYPDYEGASTEVHSVQPEKFTPEHGGVLLLLEEGSASVAGGAFKRYDEHTVELKRIWTHSAHRRRGLAALVVSALEDEAVTQGYSRVYLTTGPRQPEAVGLYLKLGYTALFDVDADPETIGFLAFEKKLKN
jgi:GNAT superfamily N-acetyltransferase